MGAAIVSSSIGMLASTMRNAGPRPCPCWGVCFATLQRSSKGRVIRLPGGKVFYVNFDGQGSRSKGCTGSYPLVCAGNTHKTRGTPHLSVHRTIALHYHCLPNDCNLGGDIESHLLSKKQVAAHFVCDDHM